MVLLPDAARARSYGAVEMDARRPGAPHRRPGAGSAPGCAAWHFTGVHVMSPRVFEFMTPEGPEDINHDVYPRLFGAARGARRGGRCALVGPRLAGDLPRDAVRPAPRAGGGPARRRVAARRPLGATRAARRDRRARPPDGERGPGRLRRRRRRGARGCARPGDRAACRAPSSVPARRWMGQIRWSGQSLGSG